MLGKRHVICARVTLRYNLIVFASVVITVLLLSPVKVWVCSYKIKGAKSPQNMICSTFSPSHSKRA
jgi:hypothetical protein